MNLLEDLLGARAEDLISEVVSRTEFGRDEAESFVPEAGRSVAGALAKRAGDLDLSDMTSGNNVAMLLEQIDIGALAGKVGLSPDKGASGLAAMLPMLLGFLGKNDSAMGALKGLAKAEGAMDSLKDIGGKLFG